VRCRLSDCARDWALWRRLSKACVAYLPVRALAFGYNAEHEAAAVHTANAFRRNCNPCCLLCYGQATLEKGPVFNLSRCILGQPAQVRPSMVQQGSYARAIYFGTKEAR